MTDSPGLVRPRAVGAAVALLLWSAAIGVVSLMATFTLDPPESVIVPAVLGILIQIGLATQVSAGRGWARRVTIGFTLLGLVYTVVGIAGIAALFEAGGVGIFLGLVGLVQTVIGIVVLVLLLQAPTVAWFSRRG